VALLELADAPGADAVRVVEPARAGAGDQMHLIRHLVDDIELQLDQPADLFKGRAGALLEFIDAGEIVGEYVFNQAGEQFVLAAEIIVDQRFGHSGFTCRLQGGGGVKALGGKKAGGGL